MLKPVEWGAHPALRCRLSNVALRAHLGLHDEVRIAVGLWIVPRQQYRKILQSQKDVSISAQRSI